MKLPEHKPLPIKKELKKRKIKLWQLAELSGCDITLISRILNGERPMNEHLEKVLKEVTK